MEAAFVEIGLDKNGFLYVDEIVGPEIERGHGRKIQDLISKGQTILVQSVKDPMKTKGARLTTQISLPGRFVVFVPQGEGLGVSRRLDDDERTRLKDILKKLQMKEGGIIVRTAAEGASEEDIERDLVFLQRLWKSIEAKAKTAKAPELIYQEAELPLRVTRDLFTGDFEKAYVDNDQAFKRITGYLKKTSPHMAERVTGYKETPTLMEAFGVDAEIRSTLSRRVDLPSGGYLIFDYAEAFTVIDVNTGRFVGGRGKNSGGRLEDTITKNNLEAVKEVVRQLRLRDIGGIIVIDFIDMANPKNRAAVEDALRTELERDRTKTYVVEISPLGLVEMTRQNVTDGPREIMTKKCPTCGGDGIVVSEHTAAVDIERRLRSLVTPGSRDKAFKVEVAAKVANLVVGPGGSRLRELEETTKRRFFLAGKDGEHLDHFRVLDQGTLEKVAPTLPFDVGAEIEVRLGEMKVKVRVTVVTEDTAWAELLTPVEPVDEPLTAEAEAEKPTRAKRPSSRKKSDGAEVVEGEAEELDDEYEDEDEDEDEADVEVDEDAVVEAPEAPADGDAPVTPKKRTRRGSRGGRNRKKKTATATGTGGAIAAASTNGGEVSDTGALDIAPPDTSVETDEPEQADESAGPVIHVPGRDLGTEDGDTPVLVKKKTRRGSRGGKNRKKKTAAAAGVGVALATAEAVADPPADTDLGDTDLEDTVIEAEAEVTVEEAPVEDAPVEEAPAPEAPVQEAPAEEPAAEPKPEEPSQNGDGDWGYTPMSQWGIDE